MLLQFFRHANGKFILLIISIIFIIRLGLGYINELNLLQVTLGYLVHVFAAVALNRIFVKNSIVKRFSVLPSVSFLLLTSNSFFLEFNESTLPFLAFCLALINLSEIYPANQVNTKLFNSGIILSLITCFFPGSLLFILPMLFCFQLIYGVNEWRKIWISITAITVPIFIYLSVQVILFNSEAFISEFWLQSLMQFDWNIEYSSSLWVLAFPVLLSMFCGVDLQVNFSKKGILARKFMLFTFLFFLISSLVFVLLKRQNSSFIYLMLPMVLLISNYFEHIKIKRIHQILFVLFIAFSLGIPFLITF
ncbi:MAG: hypothetical protein ACPG6V_05030 [Flavobacteriales bacterium]